MIGLNKGISRKNEENSQLRTDVSDLESRIDDFQTNWASQEAELGQFQARTFNQGSLERPDIVCLRPTRTQICSMVHGPLDQGPWLQTELKTLKLAFQLN